MDQTPYGKNEPEFGQVSINLSPFKEESKKLAPRFKLDTNEIRELIRWQKKQIKDLKQLSKFIWTWEIPEKVQKPIDRCQARILWLEEMQRAIYSKIPFDGDLLLYELSYAEYLKA